MCASGQMRTAPGSKTMQAFPLGPENRCEWRFARNWPGPLNFQKLTSTERHTVRV